jgi:flagellar hook-associated protein 3 FlgL
MPFRAVQAFQYRAVESRLRENLVRLQATQLDLASGKRIRTSADDPAAAGRLLTLDRTRATLDRYASSADLAYSTLSQSADEIQEGASVLAEVRERILEGLNGTLSAADRKSLASEVDRAVDRMLLSANASAEGRYLFAGSEVQTAPFARRLGGDGIERVAYFGDELEPTLELAPGVVEKTGLPGSRVFGAPPNLRETTTYLGAGTGVRPVAGLVDASRGRGTLTVTHTATSFGVPGSGVTTHAASGISLAASSPASDTILGSGHALTLAINGAGDGTASLNGGPAVSFSPGDTEITVVGPDGEEVRLDVTGAIAGYSGVATLGATGTLSANGGADVYPIDFAATRQTLVGGDGRAVFVDPSGIRKAGVERSVFAGTVDPFDALLAVRDLLRLDGDQTETAAALDEVRDFLSEIDRARDRLLSALADVAGGAGRAEATQIRVEDAKVRVEARRSGLRDVDVAEATAELSLRDDAYQASLLVAARVNNVSLLDFLR